MDNNRLQWPDYLIWTILLIFSLGVGFFFAHKEARRKKRVKGGETVEMLLGSRKMSAGPVTCSLLASYLSAIALLGTPNEIYHFGFMFFFGGIGFALAIVISVIFFIPVFYKLRITSSYEYLGMRFGKFFQICGAVVFLLSMALYMGIVTYAPCIALGVVTNINMWILVTVMIGVCTIYTYMGGIKAVVWTDVVQLMMMFIGMLSIIVKGVVDAGGFSNVIDTAYKFNRMNFEFSADVRTRYSFWGLSIGGAFQWASFLAINQAMVQRVMSLKSEKQAYMSYFLNILGMTLLQTILVLCGLVLFHTFRNCDPLLSKEISKSDQLVPFFVAKYLTQYPGIAGLFAAALFSGSLSTLSTGFNSMSAVVLRDLIMAKERKLSDRTSALISRSLVLVFGLLTAFLTYLSSLSERVLQTSLTLGSILNGPLFGLYSLGMSFPFVNNKGAIVGYVVSQVVILWISFGSYLFKIQHPRLEVRNTNCSGTGNVTVPGGSDILSGNRPVQGIKNVYAISYMWYGVITWIIVLLFGIPTSLLTKSTTIKKLDPRLISPPLRKVWQRYLLDDVDKTVHNEEVTSNL